MRIIHQEVPKEEGLGLTNMAIHPIQQTQIMKIASGQTPGITVLLLNQAECKF